jgi:hypothetical protein
MRTSAALSLLALVAIDPRPADASCIPGFDHAIFTRNTIHIQGNAGTDSYDSSVGTYAATNSCTSAHIGSNGVGAGNIHVQSNSTDVCGNVYVGAGGSPASVVSGNGNISGTKSAQATNMALPNVTFPALANAPTMNQAFNNTAGVLAPNLKYGTVSCKNGSLTLSAGKYIVTSLTLTSNCELKMGTGPIEIYFSGSLDLKSGTVVNTSQKPSNLLFYGGATATTVDVQGGVDAAFAVYAPTADCSLQGNADVWGALVCDDAHVQGNAHVHYDRALANFAGSSFTCPVKEAARATPVVATIDNQSTVVQGTYEIPVIAKTSIAVVGDVAAFSFPFIKATCARASRRRSRRRARRSPPARSCSMPARPARFRPRTTPVATASMARAATSSRSRRRRTPRASRTCRRASSSRIRPRARSAR